MGKVIKIMSWKRHHDNRDEARYVMGMSLKEFNIQALSQLDIKKYYIQDIMIYLIVIFPAEAGLKLEVITNWLP